MGYLFPITEHFQIGPQVGYSYYGSAKLENKYNSATAGTGDFDKFSGEAKIQLSSFNVSAVAEYDLSTYFAQIRAGLSYMTASSSNDYRISFVGNVPASYLYQNISFKSSVNIDLGVSVGGYITKNISLALSYDHIFGENYKTSSFNDLGDYNKSITIKAPSMDLIGAQISYHF